MFVEMAELDTQAEKIDFLFKYIIIGDTGVGKSCILNQFLRGKCKWTKSQLICLEYSQSKHEAHSGGGVRHAL